LRKNCAVALALAPALCSFAAQSPAAAHASQARELVQEAKAAQQRGDLKRAIEGFRKALAVEPRLVEAQVGLGSALMAAEDLDGAIAVEAHALDASPDNAELRTGLGIAYYRKGDMANARRQFEAVRSAHPDDVKAAVLLAFTFNKLGREADTIALLLPLEKGHESDFDLEYALGYALMMTGQHEEGFDRVERVAAARHEADVWMLAGSARFELREFKQALANAQQAVQVNPSYPGAHTLAGEALYGMGKIEDALLEFQTALRQDPTDFTANLYLGIIRFDQHDLDNARPLLELALSIHPQDPLTRLQVARLRNMEGKSADALTLLEGLEKSDPDWLDPHIELAALYYKLSRPEDGQREREIVKRLQDIQQKRGPDAHLARPK
jgi:tetratricopeptide (TPR) repeat protein